MEKRLLSQLDVGALFHSVLFAYQKTLINLLGEVSSSMITLQTMPIIEKIIEDSCPLIADAENTEVALKRFTDLLITSKLIENADIKKISEKYLLDIDGCIFAEHVHNLLNPKDATCPWAIISMIIAQKVGRRKVKISLSEFSVYRCKTPIEFYEKANSHHSVTAPSSAYMRGRS